MIVLYICIGIILFVAFFFIYVAIDEALKNKKRKKEFDEWVDDVVKNLKNKT